MLLEDEAAHARRAEEQRLAEEVRRAAHAIAAVHSDVDGLEAQVAAMVKQSAGGPPQDEKQCVMLGELLMRQLLKLDGIQADGSARLLRKTEVRRVQALVDAIDRLKAQPRRPPAPAAPPAASAGGSAKWKPRPTSRGAADRTPHAHLGAAQLSIRCPRCFHSPHCQRRHNILFFQSDLSCLLCAASQQAQTTALPCSNF
eukprot:SM000038S14389  [mRNA]  locus=s38:749021:749936:+ [translate_table: standard]